MKHSIRLRLAVEIPDIPSPPKDQHSSFFIWETPEEKDKSIICIGDVSYHPLIQYLNQNKDIPVVGIQTTNTINDTPIKEIFPELNNDRHNKAIAELNLEISTYATLNNLEIDSIFKNVELKTSSHYGSEVYLLQEFKKPTQLGEISHLIEVALTNCMKLIQQTQLNFYIVRQRFVSHLITPQLLPPALPISVTQLNKGFEISRKFTVVPNKKSNYHWGERRTSLSENEIIHFKSNINRLYSSYTSAYWDALREGELTGTKYGLYKPAILLFATAAEILFNDIYLFLQWEKSKLPSEVSSEWNRSFSQRLDVVYDALKISRADIDPWEKNIRQIRNKIAHAEYIPSEEDYTSALISIRDLTKIISDAAASVISEHPLTAFYILGDKGAKSRGKFKILQELVVIPADEANVEIRKRFNIWKDYFTSHREYINKKPRLRTNDCIPSLLFNPATHDFIACYYDENWGMARKAMIISSDLDDIKKVLSSKAEMFPEGIHLHVLQPGAIRPEKESDWVPIYHLTEIVNLTPNHWVSNQN